MWELDYKERVLKNWCFWTVVLEKTPESPLDWKEIKPVNPKGNQSWIFIGRIDVEAETPILWPADAKNWLIGKDPDAGKDWRWEEKGTTEDEMAGWHDRPDAHESEWTPGVGDGQRVCQGCILSSCLVRLYAEYIMQNAGLEETQAGIKIARRNINNLRYTDDTTLTAES